MIHLNLFKRAVNVRILTGAIDYHNREAKTFKEKYQDKRSFKKRLHTWEHLIRESNSKFDRAMDIGCGPGWMTKILCDVSNSVVAIDGAAKMLEQSRATVGDAADQVEFIEAAVVPSLFDRWPSECFDLIISSSVLEYVENAELILEKSFEVLSPSGTLIFSLPNRSSWFRMIETYLFRWLGRPAYRGLLINVWNDKDTVKMLERIGFKVDTVLWQGYVPYFSEIFFWLPNRLRKPMMIIVAKK